MTVKRTYHKNGKLKKETPYENGRKEGIEKEYIENGFMRKSTSYKKGKRDGFDTLYGISVDEDDSGIRKETYYEEGKRLGESWDCNGLMSNPLVWLYVIGSVLILLFYSHHSVVDISWGVLVLVSMSIYIIYNIVIFKKDILLLKANNGDEDAEYAIGVRYYTAEKYKTASYWFKQSAEKGNKEAQEKLGHMYYSGEGVKKDTDKGAYWTEKAKKNNRAEILSTTSF